MNSLINDMEIIDKAIKRFSICQAAWSKIHAEARDDDKFAAGDQWPEDLLRKRKAKGRPCHVVNKLKTTCRRVINEIRRNKPEIKIRPVDSGTDVATAEIINGIIRYIAYNSDAESAYDTAIEHAILHGFGWVRVITDYQSDDSFAQDVKIERIADPYSVYVPLHLCRDMLFSDAPYAFIVSDISIDDFKEKYPTVNISDWTSDKTGWISKETIRIAEYYERQESREMIYLLYDGTVTNAMPADVASVKDKREIVKYSWSWYLLTANKVLERTTWPGKYLPIVPVLGEEVLVNGQKMYLSIVRPAKDAQAIFNFWRSCETEMIALAPKAPYIGARGQFEGFEHQWAKANQENFAYLEYNPIVDATGATVLPPPRRTDTPQIPTAYVNAAKEASDDIKAVTGIYDASLGASGNETSGRAILSRQAQADITNYHYSDNYAKAIRQVGKIILDLIPIIYDTPRVLAIIGEDKRQKLVEVNKPNAVMLSTIKTGIFDVIVDTGPAYQSNRSEAVANMIELVRAYPGLAQIIGDLIVDNMDFPGAHDIAERIKRTIPAEVLQGANERQPTRQEMMQLLADMEQMRQALAKAVAIIEDKRADRSLEMDKALLNAETTLLVEKIRRGMDIDVAELRALRAADNTTQQQPAQVPDTQASAAPQQEQPARATTAPSPQPERNTGEETPYAAG